MKIVIAALSVFLALPLGAQTINPNQIRPSTTNGQVMTTVGGQTVWEAPSSGGSVQAAPQFRHYIQPNAGTVAVAGPSTTLVNAVDPIAQGLGNTDLFATGSGNNGVANFLSTYPTGYGVIQPTSTDTEAVSSLTIPSGARIDDLRYNQTFTYGTDLGPNTLNFTSCGNYDQPQTFIGITDVVNCSAIQWLTGFRNTLVSTAIHHYSAGLGTDFGNNGTNASLWTNDNALLVMNDCLRPGICQDVSVKHNSHKAGDDRAFGADMYTDGGFIAGADEGTEGEVIHVMENSTFNHSTCTSGCTTGSVDLVTTNTSGQNVYDPLGFLLDTQGGGTVNTISSFQQVLGSSAITFTTPTFTESTSWCVVSTAPTQTPPGYQQAITQTLSCTLTGSPASPADMSVGQACFAGSFNETFPITSAPASSGGIQNLTLSAMNGFKVGDLIMQGGPCGKFFVGTSSTTQNAIMLIGAFSTTQAAVSACEQGNCENESNAVVNLVIGGAGTGVTIYPGAQIIGTDGGTTNHIQLAYNTVAFNPGDTLIDPHFASMALSGFTTDATEYTPPVSGYSSYFGQWDGLASCLGNDCDMFLARLSGSSNFLDAFRIATTGTGTFTTAMDLGLLVPRIILNGSNEITDSQHEIYAGDPIGGQPTGFYYEPGGKWLFFTGGAWASALEAENTLPPADGTQVPGQLPVVGSSAPVNSSYVVNATVGGDCTDTLSGTTVNFNCIIPLATNVTGLLAHANIAPTAVTPGSYTNANITVAADGSITSASNGSGGSSGISGLTAGYVPLAGSGTTLTGNSHLDDGVTTAGVITSAEPITIGGSVHGFTVPAGTAPSGAAGEVVYASDATNGYAEVNENNTGLSRVCTAANAICPGAVTSVSNSDGTLTISPTTGAVVASLNLAHANTWTGTQTFTAPVLGTPASATLTNATGLPAASVVAGALPNGMTGTTQTTGDNTTKLATDAFVIANSSSLSPATYFATTSYTSSGVAVGTANHSICSGIIIPQGGLSVGHIAFHVGTGDGGGAVRSDVGIYSTAGTLVAHIGATSLNATTDQFIALSGGTQTIPAGPVLACYTSTGTTLSLVAVGNAPTIYWMQDAGFTTTGGALNSTITFPTLGSATYSIGQSSLAFILEP